MDKTERELFRRALTEAFVRKYERELADCQENARCSEAPRKLQEPYRQNLGLVCILLRA